MRMTTLCYIEKDDSYLMLHRTKKDKDINKGKWIGVGGHFLDRESPEECLYREVLEETGLHLTSWRFRGIITFLSEDYPTEYMCLYTADAFTGDLIECDEGDLKWIKKDELMQLNLWEGDRIFLSYLLKDYPFFSMKLRYEGDELKECMVDGKHFSSVEEAENWGDWDRENQEVKEDCYDIGSLVEHTIEDVKIQYDIGEQIQIKSVMEESVPKRLSGDAGKIGQVISKLLQNSIFFVSKKKKNEGEILVHIWGEHVSYATWIYIEIKDNGVGMTKEQLNNVKNYLKDGDTRLMESKEGLGIGLSIITYLVKLMSGTIEVMSKEGEGTRFLVNLPQLEA